MFAHLDPHDRDAQAAFDATGAGADEFLNDWATVLNILWRTDCIKKMGAAFFAQHPDSPGLNLGAGLSTYFQWLDNGANSWTDTDLPEVISLRELLLAPVQLHCRNHPLDIMQPGWWIGLRPKRYRDAKPVLIICEGVLMYLGAAEVAVVLREIGEHAPAGSELITDFIAPALIGKAAFHPSVRRTGAEFASGAHNGQELANTHPRLQLLTQHSAAEAYGWLGHMAEFCWQPYTSGPWYSLIRLGVTDGAVAPLSR